MTDVEKGFQDYFAARRIPVQITFRDLNRDASRMAGFIEEIRAHEARPHLHLGHLGHAGRGRAPTTRVDPQQNITDIPVVFTLVAAPVLAKIVRDLKNPGRNVTGVFHVAPTEAQIRAMASYRPFKTLGILYTPTEQNSVVVVEEVREVSKRHGLHGDRQAAQARRQQEGDGRRRAGDGARAEGAEGASGSTCRPIRTSARRRRRSIIPAAMAVGLPTFASTEQLMETGALTGLVSRYHSIGQFTAYKAEQILVNKVPPSRDPGGDAHALRAAGAHGRRPRRSSCRRRCRCSTTRS